ncbi:Putative uncharacterized protein [Taphrina deformans PYCC 5710]|uniref:Chloride channel protein n=1 Tax=Taphrina deformans (strain PYCC 5710 / ATCC 11124 / CBS 356.35 / IMI 108563 / JCM 9778 / NBRC 8474) TaxID=1097556 RepID=R4X802_TAPDE|nr:Putative uncharacterized protein [Taphrina deformans PYCC 5710]|eukprot:CCG81610.1 Putative uncharacterized protein [Taphrina deformans PYCC 5710]
MDQHEVPPITHRPRHASFHSFVSYQDGEESSIPSLPTHHSINLQEVKRYEDFTTIDWVQDAAREHKRKEEQMRRSEALYGDSRRLQSWKDWLWESYDAGQAWLVFMLVGACIGLNAACLNIMTEFLGDLKTGYCSNGWYLNKEFCCWGESDEGGCGDWIPWSSRVIFNYLFYIAFAILFSSSSAYLVKKYAPYAAGSGISEIKCIIGGFVMQGFLGSWTLLIKSIGLPLAIASGLSVGKEGPSVHVAVCTGNVIARFFEKYNRNAGKMREIYSACSAAGVAVAFGSPIGGILFALEEMSSDFPLKTMWRSFFCALIATAALAAVNPFRTGQLVMFEVEYDRDWHFFEIFFFAILGVFGGLYGEFVMKWNMRVAAIRKKHLGSFAIREAVTLATITAIVAYWNPFLRLDMTKSMELLFKECEGEDYDGMCGPGPKWTIVLSLLWATMVRTLFVIVTYGCKVPAGIFVPSMAIGASFGRAVGMLVANLQTSFPDAALFRACAPDVPCITPGTYAFLGAAAALSGIMHITVSVVVIMFELTGALTFILPTMIVVGITKVFVDNVGKGGGVADRMIHFNGFPFLDAKEDPNFGISVSQIMVRRLITIPVSGLTLRDVDRLLDHSFRGFPIVESRESRVLVGYIGHRELSFAVHQARRDLSMSATNNDDNENDDDDIKCFFSTATADPSSPSHQGPTDGTVPLSPYPAVRGPRRGIDFARYIDAAPLSIDPKMPLETCLDIFKTLGPRVILSVYRGRLVGLITVKDVLKFEHAHHLGGEHEGQVEATRAAQEQAEEAMVAWFLRIRDTLQTRFAEYTRHVREAVTRR